MKKILGLLGLVVLVVAGYFGYKYWDSTYNGQTAYAIVQTPTKKESKNDDGSNYTKNGQQYYYYDYELSWVTESGKKLTVGWDSPEGPNPTPITAGSIVKGKVSQKRVIEAPNVVSEGDVPESVLNQLK